MTTASNQIEHSPLKRTGVIGMGTMGSPMACSLLRSGFEVRVFNRSPEKCQTAKAQGAAVAATAAQLASESQVVFIMLADDAAVENVVCGEQGLLSGGKEGLVVVNCSTVHPRTNQRLATLLSDRNITLLDAPVTGSKPQAESGQLYFLVGGDESIYRRCIPLLEAMGRGHIHLGAIGAGACAKLGNNLMGFINLSGLVEAMEIVTQFGVLPGKFLEAISNSGGRSAFSEVKGPKILREDWSADFALKLAAKDLRLANSLAEELNRPSPLLNQTAQSFAEATAKFGEEDVCSVIRWYRQQTGN